MIHCASTLFCCRKTHCKAQCRRTSKPSGPTELGQKNPARALKRNSEEIRSKIVASTTVIDDERYMELSQGDVELIKTEPITGCDLFTKIKSKKVVKEELDVINLVSDEDEYCSPRKRICRGFPSNVKREGNF